MIAIQFSEDMNDFEVVTALTSEQKDELYKLFSTEWWTRSRSYDDLSQILANSLSIALVERSSQKLVAYSRVVTDYSQFTFIFDVIVDPLYRKKKLGTFLIEAIFSHPKLKDVEKFELRCLPELVPFYRKCGFRLPEVELITMSRKNDGICTVSRT